MGLPHCASVASMAGGMARLQEFRQGRVVIVYLHLVLRFTTKTNCLEAASRFLRLHCPRGWRQDYVATATSRKLTDPGWRWHLNCWRCAARR